MCANPNESTVAQPTQCAWKIWKTISLGTGMDAEGFRMAIKNSGMRIGNLAKCNLDSKNLKVAQEPIKVNLVVASVKDLGFKNGARLRDIYTAAEKRGLELCPGEVGPQLRLQYPDQPMDERLAIGMEPISGWDNDLELFYLDHDFIGLWFLSYFFKPSCILHADSRFVFTLLSA